MNKCEIRKNLISVRNSVKDRCIKNACIAEKVLKLSKDFNKVFIYVSFGTEVDTHEIIRKLSAETVYVPYTTPDKVMHLVVPDGMNFDKQDKLGNMPSDRSAYYDGQADLTIVPMLGFNDENYRIGYGAGCYDRYFAKYADGLKVGLAYDEQYCRFVPESSDIPLDIIITPERILRRNT